MNSNWILAIVVLGILFQNPLLGQNASNTDNSLSFNATVGLPTLITAGQSIFLLQETLVLKSH